MGGGGRGATPLFHLPWAQIPNITVNIDHPTIPKIRIAKSLKKTKGDTMG